MIEKTKNSVIKAIEGFGWGTHIDALLRGGDEVWVSIDPREFLGFADFLRQGYGAQPELIVAENKQTTAGGFNLRYIFEISEPNMFVVITTPLEKGQKLFPSLATRWYLSSLFEREIHDLFGLIPSDHPDLRRLPLHQFWPADYHPLRKDAVRQEQFDDNGAPFPFQQVHGEGTYQITVGPVHAGIIEPGHFRFSVEGETIVNLESRLFFLHKGIEKHFESLPIERCVDLAERISGDSSVAHSLAFTIAIERAAKAEPPARANYGRVVLQELERLYNHVSDVGAICTDTGFAVANSHAMRIREDLLRLNEGLCGHRLLRGVIVPGGLSRDFTRAQMVDVIETVRKVRDDFNEVVSMSLDNALVLDRLHGTGVLTNRTARELQVCGIAGRASGIDRDARRDHPYAAYTDLEFRVPVFSEGDVWTRMMIRVEEFQQSVLLLLQAIENMPSGKVLESVPPLESGATAFAVVEGWRGPVWHWVTAGETGRLARVKVKDPSFANWSALNYAILGNIVPDFPLCNKSFNLSYAGNDL